MRDRYSEKLGIRISKTMMNDLDEFVVNHNASKNSIVRQAISSFLNSVPTTSKPIAKPVPVVKKNDDPFSDSIYNW